MAEEDESTKDKIPLNRENPDEEEMQECANFDLVHTTTNESTSESSIRASGPIPRREPSLENNPFSFRHFLHADGRNYQNQGARPKVFCEGRPVIGPRESPPSSTNQEPVTMNNKQSNSRMNPEYSSALPDFVQDHLVMEQCFLGTSSSIYDAMPDFTNNSPSIPLDLPMRPPIEFPLDLPVSEQLNAGRPANSEVGNSKSLPDFLADGAVVRNQNNEILHSNSPERETERLREELDIVRRQLVEQTRRADYLREELEVAKSKEREYTQNLAKALEQVEENLERSKINSNSSESNIGKLMQEIKILNKEIVRLKKENAMLSHANAKDVASGGPSSDRHSNSDTRCRILAQDLRSAANTAEPLLRQLLNGVENLRFLASKVDTLSRSDGDNNYNTDCNSDEDVGPAL